MLKEEFKNGIKYHDWFYEYSDDHRVWVAGRKRGAELNRARLELNCPFDMRTLRLWAHNMILEDFAEEEPDCWYRQPRRWKNIAPVKREELITQKEWDKVEEWMNA